MEALFIVGGVLTLMVIGAIWRGYVLSVLWKWFIVPVFPAMPLLSIPVAIGISMAIAFLVYQHNYSEDNRSAESKLGSAAGMTLIYPALVLFMGWIVTFFL